MFHPHKPIIVGMVHLLPLPGSPRWGGSMRAVLDAAERDAHTLAEGGVDALLVENMGDVPWLRGAVEPATVAAATLAVERVTQLGLPTGVQLLAAANLEALGVAVATGATFVRVESFAYAHVADEGWIDACAGPLLRARRNLGAQVAIWADVQKKHAAHTVTADISLRDLAHGTAFAGADVLIATGASTGRPTAPDDLDALSSAGLPVAVGSGVRPDNAHASRTADAWIVGSALKKDGDWRAPVELERVRALVAARDRLARAAMDDD